MEKDTLYELARKPSLLNHDTLEGLKRLTEDNPSFHAAWFLYLKNLKVLNDPDFDAVLKKAAPIIPDRKQLYRYLNARDELSPTDFETGKAVFPVTDYNLEKPDSPVHGNMLIDKFLSAAPGSLKLDITHPGSIPPAEENDIVTKSASENDELITETLANIYLEQKKYDKALEAFKKLSLKYPEKNSYFVTRIDEIIKLKNI